MSSEQKLLYSWDFDDTKSRGALWYIIALSVAIGLILWGFLTRQYGMSIVVMLITGIFYFLENNSDDTIKVILSELGISVQNNFYDYSRVASFSIIYDQGRALYLRLHLKKKGVTFLNLRIDNTIASQIRPILSQYLEENTKEEITFLEKITHILKL